MKLLCERLHHYFLRTLQNMPICDEKRTSCGISSSSYSHLNILSIVDRGQHGKPSAHRQNKNSENMTRQNSNSLEAKSSKKYTCLNALLREKKISLRRQKILHCFFSFIFARDAFASISTSNRL